jgi:hypothetical protein
MKKKIGMLFLFATCIGLYFYINQDHRNIGNEKPTCFVSAMILQNDLNVSESLVNKKYLDKTVNVIGKITNIDFANNTLEIDEKVLAVFKDSIVEKLALNQQVSIKGRFIGHDDLFNQFRLDEVVLGK